MEKHFNRIIKQLNKETQTHCERVALLFKELAPYLKMDARLAYEIGLLHDIGKMYIPGRIIRKSSGLSVIEREIVDTHSYYGYRFLKEEGFDDEICIPILLHHGMNKKKPSELCSITENNMRYARALHTIDVYDAITSDRVYRKKMDNKKDVFEILHNDLFCDATVISLLYSRERDEGVA